MDRKPIKVGILVVTNVASNGNTGAIGGAFTAAVPVPCGSDFLLGRDDQLWPGGFSDGTIGLLPLPLGVDDQFVEPRACTLDLG